MDGNKSESELSKRINVLEGLYFIKAAFKKVTSTTTKNCFSRAGFTKGKGHETHFDLEDNQPFSAFANLLLSGIAMLGAVDDQRAEDFITLDLKIAVKKITLTQTMMWW